MQSLKQNFDRIRGKNQPNLKSRKPCTKVKYITETSEGFLS